MTFFCSCLLLIYILHSRCFICSFFFFFFNDTATTEIYTLSLHDALPICPLRAFLRGREGRDVKSAWPDAEQIDECHGKDRKSTRLNSSHVSISYAVFCLKKKKKKNKKKKKKTKIKKK